MENGGWVGITFVIVKKTNNFMLRVVIKSIDYRHGQKFSEDLYFSYICNNQKKFKMKNYLTLLLIFSAVICFGQKEPKIDFDDDVITVDKVKKYDFVLTKKGGFTSLEASKIVDLAGEIVFIVKDTILYLDQLENELEEKREFAKGHVFIAPKLNKIAFVEPIMLTKARGTVFKKLKKTAFFTSEGKDTTWFNQMVNEFGGKYMMKKMEEYNLVNASRKINAQKTNEKYGPMLQRKPAAIQSSTVTDLILYDGGKKVGTLKMDKKHSGLHSTTYDIINSDKKLIGHFYHQPSESAGNIVTEVDGVRKQFVFNYQSTMDDILTMLNEYLIYYGYL